MMLASKLDQVLLPIFFQRGLDRRHLLVVFNTQVDVIDIRGQATAFALEHAVILQGTLQLARDFSRLKFRRKEKGKWPLYNPLHKRLKLREWILASVHPISPSLRTIWR